MASLIQTQLMVNALLREHGLADLGWRFEWDNAVRRAGACHYAQRKITMSRKIIPLWTDEESRQTAIHEIAHALTPGAHHGYAWQKKAREIGFVRGTRTHNGAVPEGRYLAICDHCDTEAGRMHRLSDRRRMYSIHQRCGKPVRWVDTGLSRV